MEETFGRLPAIWRRFPMEERAWVPALEDYEREDRFMVRAELPGMKKEEIDVSVLANTLTIKGERKAGQEVKEEEYHRCEMCYGAFSRFPANEERQSPSCLPLIDSFQGCPDS